MLKYFFEIEQNEEEWEGNLPKTFGVPISASTLFEQCEHVADAVMPVFYALKRTAANSK